MLNLIALFFSLAVGLELPHQMDGSDQVRTMEILGLGSSTKFLSKAWPLGGYSGVETSLSMDLIDTSQLSQMGDGSSQRSTLALPTLTLGKGLYNGMDLYLHFLPGAAGLTRYGLNLRWSFYQALFLPLNFSLLLKADSTNFNNQLVTENLGADLMVGIALSDFSFFLGGGYGKSAGTFTGGSLGVTESGANESRLVESSHFMFGATYTFAPFFIGLAIDRYADATYSIKTGLNF